MFNSAFLKIDRARHHLSHLAKAFAEYVASKPIIVSQASTDHFVITIAKELPPSLPLIAGDVIQNLMASLDYSAWELVNYENQKSQNPKKIKESDIYFPCSTNDKSSFEAKIERLFTGNSTRNFLKNLEAFPKGKGHDIQLLKNLSNIEKHRFPIEINPVVHRVIENTSYSFATQKFPTSARYVLDEGSQIMAKDFPDVQMIFSRDIEALNYADVLRTLEKFADVSAKTVAKILDFTQHNTQWD